MSYLNLNSGRQRKYAIMNRSVCETESKIHSEYVGTVKPVQSEHRRDRRKSFSITGCSQRRGLFIAKNYFRDLSKPFRLAGCS